MSKNSKQRLDETISTMAEMQPKDFVACMNFGGHMFSKGIIKGCIIGGVSVIAGVIGAFGLDYLRYAKENKETVEE